MKKLIYILTTSLIVIAVIGCKQSEIKDISLVAQQPNINQQNKNISTIPSLKDAPLPKRVTGFHNKKIYHVLNEAFTAPDLKKAIIISAKSKQSWGGNVKVVFFSKGSVKVYDTYNNTGKVCHKYTLRTVYSYRYRQYSAIKNSKYCY